MLGSWGLICIGFATVGLLLGVSITSAAADNASGTLQIGEKRFALKHAFAVMEQDVSAGGDKEKVTVLLSDLPVPDDLRQASDDWRYWAQKQARAGALHGVIISINPATGVWDHGQVLTSRDPVFYSETASSPELRDLRFEPAGPIGDQVAGKVSMKAPLSSAHDEDGRWRVEAEFRSAVIRRAALSGVLTGSAAENSPQYKAVLAFLNACQKKDLDAIRNSMSPQSRETLAEMIASGKEAALDMFAGGAAETASLKLSKVTIRGDSAEVEFVNPKPGAGGRETYSVALSNGEWKLAQ
ncbi:MAG: hypothetical protein ABSE56_06405 [Bryobacteraceae bacterium]|jgi:hypothetical protein